MAEWSKAHDWKSCVPPKGTVGSNPTLSAIYKPTSWWVLLIKISLTQQEELKADIKNKVRVCEILKKYGITKPTYYRYKENFGL